MRKYLILTFVCLLFVFDSKAQVEITSAGTSSAYTLNVPGVFPLRNGIQVTFKAHTTCSASATMNVSSTGALPIRKDGNTNVLSGGDIQTGQIVTLAYDGSNWQMMSPVGNPVSIPATYWNPNGSDIYNTNIGEVGIGTTTPASKLDVSGDVNTNDVYKIDGVTFLNNLSSSTLVGSTLNTSLSGQYNTFVGEGAGAGTTTPMRNTFVGRYAGNGNVTGADNTSLGAQAAWQANSSYNTSVGAYSNSALTSGGFNTSLGYGAGQNNTTGVNNTIIGANANVDVNNLQYATAIGAGATVGQSYSMVLGGTGANALKVGIGNNAPSHTLHVTGNARITDLVGPGTVIADASGVLSIATGGTITGSGAATQVAFWNGTNTLSSNTNLFWDNTNFRLGVGISSPGLALHIFGTNATTAFTTNGGAPEAGLRLHNNNLTNNNYSSIGFSTQLSNSGISEMGKIVVQNVNHTIGTVQGDMIFLTNGNGLTERMRITGGGNVGIGTTTPTNALSFGNTSNQKIWIENSVGATIGRALTISSGEAGAGFNNTNGGDMIIQAGAGTGTGTSSIIFQNGTTLGNSPTTQTMSTKMIILGNGNVGIGTTAPNSPLSVGASNQFQVDGNGNLIRINNVTYSWPAANGSGFLSNNGSGTLTWSTAGVLAGGTTNYVPKWSSANSLSSTSLIFDNGTTVGINTAAPSASSKLHVVGAGNGSTLNVDDNGLTNGSVLYLASNSTAGTASNSSRMISISRSGANTNASHTAYGLQSIVTNTGTTNTNVAGYFSASGGVNDYAIIVPNNGGRVGIGTSSPMFTLHAETSLEDRTAYFYNTTNTTNTTFAVYGGAYGAGSGEKRGGSFEAVNGTGTNIALRAYASGATNNYAFISPPGGGRVGIGTTAPISLVHLEVPSSDAINPIGLTVTNNYTGASAKYGIDVNVDGAGSGSKYGISSSVIGLAGDASSIYGYQVAMTPNGSGTSYGAYASQSSVGTGSRFGYFTTIGHSSTSTSLSYGIYSTITKPFGSSGNIFGAYLSTAHSGTGAAYGVYTINETYNYFENNLGIGTNVPAYQLQLSLNSAAKPTSSTWIVTSDARLKTNVHPYESGLTDLMKIKPVWFTYTGEANMPKETGVGVLAQELQEVAPYMVKEWTYYPNIDPEKNEVQNKEGKKYLAVDNGAMTYMLINAVKEQQAQIEELKKQLEEQKKQLEKLEKK